MNQNTYIIEDENTVEDYVTPLKHTKKPVTVNDLLESDLDFFQGFRSFEKTYAKLGHPGVDIIIEEINYLTNRIMLAPGSYDQKATVENRLKHVDHNNSDSFKLVFFKEHIQRLKNKINELEQK